MPKKYTNVPNANLDSTLPFAQGGRSDGQLEPDYQDSYDSWKKTPTSATRGALLKNVQPVIDSAVYSYAGPKPSPNTRSQARLMAIKAFDTYDPQRGNMRTHLLSQLQGIRRQSARSQQIISIPERVSLDRRHLREAEESLTDNLGRDPSDLEIADHSGLSLKRIEHIRRAKPGTNTGSILGEDGEVYSPPSTIPGDTNTADAWLEMIYHDLGNADRVILDYTLGLHGAPSQSNREIANRLGLTEGAISQRKQKIQLLLDEQYNTFGDG